MLKYLKQKPILSVLAIAALTVATLGILLITKPSGVLPTSTGQTTSSAESTMAQTSVTEPTTPATTTQTSGMEEASAIKTASTVSSAAASKPAATVKVTTQTKFTTKPTTKATTKPRATTKKPTTTAVPSSGGGFADFQARVIALVNEERTSRGLKALTGYAKLSDVATLKSQDMADRGYFDHISPTYGSPFDMMKQFGISYRAAGENIAMGQTTPEQVMNGWMNSDGHRANILNASFTQIGVGIAKNASGRIYWTQMFIG